MKIIFGSFYFGRKVEMLDCEVIEATFDAGYRAAIDKFKRYLASGSAGYLEGEFVDSLVKNVWGKEYL